MTKVPTLVEIREKMLENDYESVRLEFPEYDLKPYTELTAQEKENHAKIFQETSEFFHNLGEAIRTGSELPNPMDIGK